MRRRTLCVYSCMCYCVLSFSMLCAHSVRTHDSQCPCVDGLRLLCARAIRFQSHASMWLSCCRAGAPWGNVIIPCWPQSTGFTALSVSGETAARGPFSLAISNSVSLKPRYISKICIKSLLRSPPLISF